MRRTLVLHTGYSVRASYYDDWLAAFKSYPDFETVAVDLYQRPDYRSLARKAAAADLIVMLHSATADTLDFVLPIKEVLNSRKGPLVIFAGNEFNRPWLLFETMRDFFRSIGADWIATQLLQKTGEWLYEGSGARVTSVPHALNPAVFVPPPEGARRQIDIGCRSFPYPVYLGTDSRNALLRAVSASPAARDLVVDISTSSRFDRDGWADFLRGSRATVATEAGSLFLDREDGRTLEIQAFQRLHRKGMAVSPQHPLRWMVRKLPWPVRERLYKLAGRMNIHHEALLDDPGLNAEILDRFFPARSSELPHGGCVSSRHFDAIGCETLQLLVRGRYSDILEPDVDYVPIEPDLSNLDEALARLRDPDFGRSLVKQARERALSMHTHAHRIDALLRAVDQ